MTEWLVGIATVVVAIVIAWRKSRAAAEAEQEAREADAYQKTMEAAHDADIAPDAAAAREWLRNRDPDQR